MKKANGTKPGGLLGVIGKPNINKDKLLAKMAKIPDGYTHVGLANTELGLTAVVAHQEYYRPLIWNPHTFQWEQLLERTKGGVIV